MKALIGKSVLITTSDWFYAPDGRMYKAVWGTIIAIQEDKEAFGFAVNRSHANWLITIGNMTIAGCRVLYAIKCDTPNFGRADEYQTGEAGVVEFSRPSAIYDANSGFAKGGYAPGINLAP